MDKLHGNCPACVSIVVTLTWRFTQYLLYRQVVKMMREAVSNPKKRGYIEKWLNGGKPPGA